MTAPLRILPTARPQITRDEVKRILALSAVTEVVALLGIRGYYRDTMGVSGANDRGIYDDAIIVVSPTAFVTFNANTDPSVARTGIAVLAPGVWFYTRGLHGITKEHPYPALVQAKPVTVVRDGGKTETGYFGINIHRGSRTSTSSLGCQTLYPDQWDSFYGLVSGEMTRHNTPEIPYCLIDEAQRR
ncbi:MAG TPA: hypothetical protein VFN76_10060 [Candidatus Limnocylindria bacterium]|nr:hypothetical protein [Candidatus Limnocylindria bacterium]